MDPSVARFLPKFRAELDKAGISDPRGVCEALAAGAKQPPLASLEEYQRAWSILYAAEAVRTDDYDGSPVEEWVTALAHRVFDFEDAFKAKHGYMPLNPALEDWYEVAGRA